MADSGLGRTMSSCGRPRLRSRSEERQQSHSSSLALLNVLGPPTVSARSDPFCGESSGGRAHIPARRQQHQESNSCSSCDDNSVLAGIPQPLRSSGVFSQTEQHSAYLGQRRRNEEDEREGEKRTGGSKREEEAAVDDRLSVPPLNSKRLQATRHRTKNAILTILDNGEICIEFIKRRFGKERVSEVCRISGDGLRVILYKAPEGTTVGMEPPPLPARGADSIHSYENLPQRHHRKYMYAARFVQLVRAKTPKLTLYTSRAKCLFMENGPSPDCEVHFYNGAKVTQVGGVVKIVQDAGGTSSPEGELSSRSEELREHFSQCYQRCLLLDSTLTALETATDYTCFPAIFGRRPTSAGLTDSAPCPLSGKENVSHAMTSPPVMPSFDGGCSVVSTVASGSRRSTSVRNYSNDNTNGSCCVNNRVTVPGIGIATQLPSGDVRVDYRDGSALTVSPQSLGGGLTYESNSGRVTRYDQMSPQWNEAAVPSAIRDKLRHLPTVIKYLVQPKPRTIR